MPLMYNGSPLTPAKLKTDGASYWDRNKTIDQFLLDINANGMTGDALSISQALKIISNGQFDIPAEEITNKIRSNPQFSNLLTATDEQSGLTGTGGTIDSNWNPETDTSGLIPIDNGGADNGTTTTGPEQNNSGADKIITIDDWNPGNYTNNATGATDGTTGTGGHDWNDITIDNGGADNGTTTIGPEQNTGIRTGTVTGTGTGTGTGTDLPPNMNGVTSITSRDMPGYITDPSTMLSGGIMDYYNSMIDPNTGMINGYGGNRIAGVDPLQQSALDQVQNAVGAWGTGYNTGESRMDSGYDTLNGAINNYTPDNAIENMEKTAGNSMGVLNQLGSYTPGAMTSITNAGNQLTDAGISAGSMGTWLPGALDAIAGASDQLGSLQGNVDNIGGQVNGALSGIGATQGTLGNVQDYILSQNDSTNRNLNNLVDPLRNQLGAANSQYDKSARSSDQITSGLGVANNAYGVGTGVLGSANNQIGSANGYLGGASGYLSQAGQMASSTGEYDPNQMNSHLSPYLSGVNNEIARLGNRNLMENVLPNVNSTFAGNGQFGSTRNAEFTNRAIRDSNESILGAQSTAMNQAYGQAATDYLGWNNAKNNAAGTLANIGQAQGNLGSIAGNLANTQANIGSSLVNAGNQYANTTANVYGAQGTAQGNVGTNQMNLGTQGTSALSSIYQNQLGNTNTSGVNAGNLSTTGANLGVTGSQLYDNSNLSKINAGSGLANSTANLGVLGSNTYDTSMANRSTSIGNNANASANLAMNGSNFWDNSQNNIIGQNANVGNQYNGVLAGLGNAATVNSGLAGQQFAMGQNTGGYALNGSNQNWQDLTNAFNMGGANRAIDQEGLTGGYEDWQNSWNMPLEAMGGIGGILQQLKSGISGTTYQSSATPSDPNASINNLIQQLITGGLTGGTPA